LAPTKKYQSFTVSKNRKNTPRNQKKRELLNLVINELIRKKDYILGGLGLQSDKVLNSGQRPVGVREPSAAPTSKNWESGTRV